MKWIILFILFLFFSPSVFADGVKYPLHEAAGAGDIKRVKELLADGYDVNTRNDSQKTPLFGAVYDGQVDMVKFLLGQGADPNTQDKNNYRPINSVQFKYIYWDVYNKGKIKPDKYDSVEIIKLLVDAGASFNSRGNSNDLENGKFSKFPVDALAYFCREQEKYDDKITSEFFSLIRQSDFKPDERDIMEIEVERTVTAAFGYAGTIENKSGYHCIIQIEDLLGYYGHYEKLRKINEYKRRNNRNY